MKKQILFIGTLLSFGIGFSQNTFPTLANTAVGIGTGTPAVSGAGGLRLKVTSGVANTSGIQLTNLTSTSTVTSGLLGKALSVNSTGNLVLVPVANSDTDLSIFNNDGTLAANRTVSMNAKNLTFDPLNINSQFFINGTNGNVGVGTVTPTTRLDVVGDLKGTSGIFTKSLTGLQNFATNTDRVRGSLVLSAGTLLDAPSGVRTFGFMDMPANNFNPEPWSWFNIDDRNFSTRLRLIAKTGKGSEFVLFDKNQSPFFTTAEDNDYVIFTLPKPNSHVGIGTSNFFDGADEYRLSVKGKIRAEEIKVYNTWADYVFEKDYDLKPLSEVEKFINENKHLPNVPSAKDVIEKGLELGNMSKIQQEKIEELTLYLIQQNKEIQELKAQMKNLTEKKQ
ncbi:hypothetical protein [Flavobacterium sp.]|uniref:hypothetical protein n=1 Tax=Flavobacterium sp. TaxID=239 RepID=UPI00375198E0